MSLTNFTSTSHNNSLKGVRIYLRNPRIEYVSNNLNDAPLSHIDKLALEPGTGGVSLMSAAQNKGAGTSSIVWGNQKELNEQFENSAIELVENDAIQLFVPRETTADVETYRSTLSWELSDIPGLDA
nr:WxL domain-containing protein [Carnobacterium maltaromaticum]